MIAIIISICASVISGTLLFLMQRYFNQREKHEEKSEERREKKDTLILKCLKAIGELTVANAIAVKEGKSNDEMNAALAEFRDVDKELFDFLIHNATKK